MVTTVVPERRRSRPDPSARADGGPSDPAALRSCLYEGVVTHRRHVDVDHRLAQRVLMALVDLDELDRVFAAHPLWSTTHPAPVRFRRSDMHGDPEVALATAVRASLEAGLGTRPTGRIQVLTTLRHWSWTFNPLSLYFALAPPPEGDGRGDGPVEAVLAEVTNTPWHERRAYALAAPTPAAAATTGIRFAKDLHVSPFLDLDLDHVLRFTPPGGDRMTVEMESRTRGPDDAPALTARLALRRRPLDRSTMTAVLLHHGAPSHRISAGIHLNAVRLWREGAPFRRHPKHQTGARTR